MTERRREDLRDASRIMLTLSAREYAPDHGIKLGEAIFFHRLTELANVPANAR